MTTKTFWVCIYYDNGNYNEYYLEAENEDQAYDLVYMDIGYDPGEVYVEETDIKETV